MVLEGIIKGGLELHCLETNYDHQVSLESYIHALQQARDHQEVRRNISSPMYMYIHRILFTSAIIPIDFFVSAQELIHTNLS
jgi:hypothetical protein